MTKLTVAHIKTILADARRPLYNSHTDATSPLEVAPGVTVSAYRLYQRFGRFAWHHVYRIEAPGSKILAGMPHADHRCADTATTLIKKLAAEHDERFKDYSGQDEFESQLPGAAEWDGVPPDVSYNRPDKPCGACAGVGRFSAGPGSSNPMNKCHHCDGTGREVDRRRKMLLGKRGR